MSKHTPGPWNVINSKKEEWYGRPLDYWTVAAKENDLWICASPEWDPEHDEESTANARLIASAPELLEACQTFAEWLRREDEGFPEEIRFNTPEGEAKWREWYGENLRVCALAMEQARAAIAKARGDA
jgi:hypothetical protein